MILGLITSCLESFTWEEDGSLQLDQATYLTKVLERFGMQDCKPVATPLEVGLKLSKEQCPVTEEEIAKAKNLPYRELIGSLMYLSQATQPDISYAVEKLEQLSDDTGLQASEFCAT